MVKKMNKVILDAFHAGLVLGFFLGDLPARVVPKILGKTEEEIEAILEEDLSQFIERDQQPIR